MTTATGLRERKKQKTREEIARAAMKLFRKRGFDAVTVAEVAEAAGVSEKTVFNYFPAKEDLVWPDGERRWDALVEAIRARPPGTPVVKVFRAHTEAMIDRLEASPEDFVARPRLVMGSAALRGRLAGWWEHEAALLAPVIAEAAGADPNDVVPAVVARTLSWTHRTTFRAAFTRLLAGDEPELVARELRKQAAEAYDLLEGGLASYGRATAS
jgi:AcrR family transcriptional regulator